jgi:predicted nuclease with TOPRIM domain
MKATINSLKTEQNDLKEETAQLKHKVCVTVTKEEKENLLKFSTDVERQYDVLAETNSSLLASNTKMQKDYNRVQEALSYLEERYCRLEQHLINIQRANVLMYV